MISLNHRQPKLQQTQSLVEDFEVEEALDRAELPFRNYIRVDVDALTRDLQIENHFSEGTNGVHVFTG